jgi:hypothetical protein
MKLYRIAGISVILIFLTGSLAAQNSWIVKKFKEGIKISTRQSNRSKFDDIMVEMDMPGNIYQVATILLDVNKYNEWAYSTKRSLLIKKISATKLIYYSEFSAPWPVTNRDLYAVMELYTDTAFHLLKVNSVGSSNYQPVKKDLIRIPYSKGVWYVTTLSDHQIHLKYVLEMDPGGSVPAWILNLFSTKGPWESFKNLKNKMILLNPGV